MAVGIFNPKDTARTVTTRPTHVNGGEAVVKWMSDVEKSRPKSQDWNALIANFRIAAAAFAITDQETNTDNILRDTIVKAALLGLGAGTGGVEKTDATTFAVYTLAAFGKTLAATANAAAARTALGLAAVAISPTIPNITGLEAALAGLGATLPAGAATGVHLKWSGSAWVSGDAVDETAARENWIDSPSFDLWQAGISFALAAATPTFVADRWKAQRSVAGSTITRQAGVAGARYMMRHQRDSGNTSTATMQVFWQMDPDMVRQFQGETVVLSLDVRAGADYSGGNLSLVVYTGTVEGESIVMSNSPDFGTGPVSQGGPALLPTTGVQRMSTIDAAVAIVIPSNARALAVKIAWVPVGTAGVDDWLEYTNVKLEICEIATKFDPPRREAVAAACERFYQKSFPRETTPGANAGQNTGEERFAASKVPGSTNMTYVSFRRSMRAAPVVTLFNPSSGAANQVYNNTIGIAGSSGVVSNATDRGFLVKTAAESSGAIAAVADDLGVHWVADARL